MTGRYTYRRVGIGDRPIELLADGAIGLGKAACEEAWRLVEGDGRTRLEIHGRGERQMRLWPGPCGVWLGQWDRYECGAVQLVPGDWHFRHGTQDGGIFESIVLHNEYALPDSFDAEDVILDVGGHVGTFAFACLARGAGKVWTYEPEPGNYSRLEHHLLWTFPGRFVATRAALYRSDRPAGPMLYGYCPDPNNTGGGSLLNGNVSAAAPTVTALRFDDAVLQATDNGRRRIRLCKFDCEGSEFPILATSHTLHLIDEICGEYHEAEAVPDHAQAAEIPEQKAEWLKSHLYSHGFTVEIKPTLGGLGLFWAKKP